jgi:hypothetical protein
MNHPHTSPARPPRDASRPARCAASAGRAACRLRHPRHALLAAAALCAAISAPGPAQTPIVQPPLLPEAIASFGAARAGDWLYVYGGHTGEAHAHSARNVTGAFRRLPLRGGDGWGGEGWQDLPSGPALQGTALVAHRGALYRVGGMTAHNEPGAEEDLHSLASVQRFDPAAGTWEDVTPLPEPRSSHDACVLGDKLYVVGGWALSGAGEGEWHDTAWVADLNASPLVWEALPRPPFHRRALAVAPAGSRIAVIGGMCEDDGMTPATAFYDLASASWSKGPDLPGSGFGMAAIAVEGRLFASGMDGQLLELAADGSAWQVVTTLAFPRFFHRLLPGADGELVALGGAGRGGHMRTVELASPSGTPPIHEWRVDVPSSARNRHGLLLRDHELVAFGGNRSLEQHDFRPEDFTADAFRLNLASMQAAPLPAFPVARQSMETVQWGRRQEKNLILGGFGHDGDVARSHADVFAFSFGGRERGERGAGTDGAAATNGAAATDGAATDGDTTPWSGVAASLPEARTQFAAVEHDGQVWIFGGTDYDPRREGGPANDVAYPLDVLVYDPAKPGAAFESSGVQLPRPRRAFAAAKVGAKLYLIGGMRAGFQPVEEIDVFDFASRTWSTAPAPARPRISPQAAVIAGRIYVAGGSSKDDEGEFATNVALEVLEPHEGWRTVAQELPNPMRHVRMLALRDRLLFFSSHFDQAGQAAIWMLRPEPDLPSVVESAFHR